MWKGIVNVSNWTVNKITKPCFAEIKSCPKTVTMGAAPSTEVKVKVEVLSVLFLEIFRKENVKYNYNQRHQMALRVVITVMDTLKMDFIALSYQ